MKQFEVALAGLAGLVAFILLMMLLSGHLPTKPGALAEIERRLIQSRGELDVTDIVARYQPAALGMQDVPNWLVDRIVGRRRGGQPGHETFCISGRSQGPSEVRCDISMAWSPCRIVLRVSAFGESSRGPVTRVSAQARERC